MECDLSSNISSDTNATVEINNLIPNQVDEQNLDTKIKNCDNSQGNEAEKKSNESSRDTTITTKRKRKCGGKTQPDKTDSLIDSATVVNRFSKELIASNPVKCDLSMHV